jgi:hypothetical protein
MGNFIGFFFGRAYGIYSLGWKDFKEHIVRWEKKKRGRRFQAFYLYDVLTAPRKPTLQVLDYKLFSMHV